MGKAKRSGLLRIARSKEPKKSKGAVKKRKAIKKKQSSVRSAAAAATGMGLSMPTQTTSDGHAVQSFASQQSMAPPQSSLLLQVLSASAVGASDPFSGMIKADAHRARMDAVKQAKLEKKKGVPRYLRRTTF